LSVAIHRDARHIVFLRGAGVLSIMELGLATAGRPVRLPDLPWTVRFSPNGDVLALGAGSHVYLYASSTLFAVGPS
jgi:hypothetical protein